MICEGTCESPPPPTHKSVRSILYLFRQRAMRANIPLSNISSPFPRPKVADKPPHPSYQYSTPFEGKVGEILSHSLSSFVVHFVGLLLDRVAWDGARAGIMYVRLHVPE